jgi:hypothetical protein
MLGGDMARVDRPLKQEGTDPVVRVNHSQGVPKDIHPEAVIEHPPTKPGEKPVTQKVVLEERC